MSTPPTLARDRVRRRRGQPLAAAMCSMGLDPGMIEEWLALHEPVPSSSAADDAAHAAAPRSGRPTGRDAGRSEVVAADIALGMLVERRQGRLSGDHLIAYGEQRGLDTQELRERIVRAAADPGRRRSVLTPLPKRHPSQAAASPGVDGSRTRIRWGTTRGSAMDGGAPSRSPATAATSRWTATTGSSSSTPTGIYVRSRDGRPVGYRYRVLTKVPKRMPGRPRTEVLPMPPVPMRRLARPPLRRRGRSTEPPRQRQRQRHRDHRRADQAQDREAGRGHDHARGQAGRGRGAPDERVAEALQPGPLDDATGRWSAAPTRRRSPGSSRTRAGTGRGTARSRPRAARPRPAPPRTPAWPSRRGSPARSRSGPSGGPTPGTARTSRTCAR